MAPLHHTQQCQHPQMAPSNQENYKSNSSSARYHGTTPGTSSQQPTIAPNHPTNGTSPWHQTQATHGAPGNSNPPAVAPNHCTHKWAPTCHPAAAPHHGTQRHLCSLLKYTPPPTPENRYVFTNQTSWSYFWLCVYVNVAGPPDSLMFSKENARHIHSLKFIVLFK